MFTLDSSAFDSVRGAIGLEADLVSMPDSIINLPIHKGEAERFVMRELTPAQYTAYPDESIYIAVLYLASILVKKMRIVQHERIAGGSLTYEKTNLDSIAMDLEAQARNRIAWILGQMAGVPPVGEFVNPNFFIKARRRMCRVSGVPDR